METQDHHKEGEQDSFDLDHLHDLDGFFTDDSGVGHGIFDASHPTQRRNNFPCPHSPLRAVDPSPMSLEDYHRQARPAAAAAAAAAGGGGSTAGQSAIHHDALPDDVDVDLGLPHLPSQALMPRNGNTIHNDDDTAAIDEDMQHFLDNLNKRPPPYEHEKQAYGPSPAGFGQSYRDRGEDRSWSDDDVTSTPPSLSSLPLSQAHNTGLGEGKRGKRKLVTGSSQRGSAAPSTQDAYQLPKKLAAAVSHL